MKVARYIGEGQIAIVDEPVPACPPGGLLVKTEACGLCSGELMAWYMDRKIPHVLGHEVCARVVESNNPDYPEGMRVFPHHHAPCMKCELCLAGLYVHCEQWRRTKLVPGGMAEYFAVGQENLNDTIDVEGIRPVDAALIEPLACVVKSIRMAGPGSRPAVIGLGVMGLMHALMLGPTAVGYEFNPARIEWAQRLGITVNPDEVQPDLIFVCPGSQDAFNSAMAIARPGATIVMFAPLAPFKELSLPQDIYFRDIKLVHSYSCGPNDSSEAADAVRGGKVVAEQVISNFIGIEELPLAYAQMKAGSILKPMVVFPD